jgi:hypothetical protein
MKTFRVCRFRRTPDTTNVGFEFLGAPWRATVRDLRAACKLDAQLANPYTIDPDRYPLHSLELKNPVVLVRGSAGLLVERVR